MLFLSMLEYWGYMPLDVSSLVVRLVLRQFLAETNHLKASTFEIVYFFGYESRFDLSILFIMIYTFLSRWLVMSLIRCI